MDLIETFDGLLRSQNGVAPWSGPNGPGFVVADPVSIDHVLKSASYGKGQAWRTMRQLLFPRSGALSANDDPQTWRAYRIPVNRSLAPSALRDVMAPMATIVDEEIRTWPIDSPFDLASACTRIIQRLIVQVFFGAGLSSEDSQRAGTALVDVLRLIAADQQEGAVPSGDDSAQQLHGLLQRLIRDSDRGIVTAFIDMDPAVGSEILLNLFLAGFETPSLAVAWTLALLAAHPDQESRVVAEMSEKGAAVPSMENYRDWPMMTAALDESMRLFTPLWAIPREAFNDDVLPTGHRVHAGSHLMLSALHMHRSTDVWGADAAGFRPDRFLDRAHCPALIDRRTYLPFGAGARICPAEMLARVEMMICLHRILDRFVVELIEFPSWEPAFTLRPKGGMQVCLHPRAREPIVHAARSGRWTRCPSVSDQRSVCGVISKQS